MVEEGYILCEGCFPLQVCHVSVEMKKNERASKAVRLFPVLWHSDGVKGGREQGMQSLQTFQNQQTYKIIQRK